MGAIDSTVPPLVTVVTPVYNVAKYVGETVDSVLRQTFTNFEYLVVDDGSEAGVGELARSGWGRRFLFWDTLPPSGRQLVRGVQSSARGAVKTANRVRRG